MNSNTVVGYIGGTGRNQIASQTLASTTETEFHLNTDASSAICVLTVPQQSSIKGSSNPKDVAVNAALLEGYRNFTTESFDKSRPFLVRLAGVATPASNGGNTLTLILYSGATKSGTAIATTGAVPEASTTAARGFILEAQLIWDLSSTKLNGQFWFFVSGTSGTEYTTWAASTEATVATAASLQFCASATWGNAVGGVCAVSEFSISQL